MNGKRALKRLASPAKRCRHSHCGDCATRRGSNRGNRRERHDTKALLRQGVQR